jgi:hypothetical protein
MKYMLLLILAVSCNATPIILSDTNFSPAAEWPGAFEKEPWWSAFLAMNRPESLVFSEWKSHFSAKLLATTKIDSAKFEEIKKEEAEKRIKDKTSSKIARIVTLRDGELEYVFISQSITSPDYLNDVFTKIQIFEKNLGRWIAYEIADLKSDPILKAIDEK